MGLKNKALKCNLGNNPYNQLIGSEIKKEGAKKPLWAQLAIKGILKMFEAFLVFSS